MPIKRRQKSNTDIYHVIVKGINKEKIFNQQREKIYFKSIILKHLSKHQIEIYGYCIMSNHAHFIIRAEIKLLSSFMAAILAEYALYYNYKHHRNGHVFQNRFISECIETDKYFWSCLRYIHLNPVKAKMVKKPERYKYSSMAEYVLDTPIIIPEKAIELMKKTYQSVGMFQEFHYQRQMELFNDINDEVRIQQEEIAFLIAEQMKKEYYFPLLCQVIEEKEIREEYLLRLQKSLKISKRKAKELCLATRNKIENTK